MKLQKELSQRMETMSLNSQDSVIRGHGTMKRFGAIMSRLAGEGQETASPRKNEPLHPGQAGQERPQSVPFAFPATLSATQLMGSQVSS